MRAGIGIWQNKDGMTHGGVVFTVTHDRGMIIALRDDVMRVPGKRVKERQLIERGRLVVAVEVDLVYPDFDPDEP